jgi:hypothetical protein
MENLNRLVVLFFAALIFSSCAHSQMKTSDIVTKQETFELSLKDESLLSCLDTIIKSETNYRAGMEVKSPCIIMELVYYKGMASDTSIIRIQRRDDGIHYIKDSYGYVQYQNFLVIVEGRNKQLFSTLFCNSKPAEVCDYHDYEIVDDSPNPNYYFLYVASLGKTIRLPNNFNPYIY